MENKELLQKEFDELTRELKDKELLQKEFDELTRELKDMDSSDSRYARVWDERAEISRKLNHQD